MKYDLSVCIPAYNSSKTISLLVEAIFKELASLKVEIIIVNDGSRDQTETICLDLEKKYPDLKFYSLRKNFGENNAVMCALNHATGPYAVIIDDDFQNPPKEILKLYESIQKGYDVVFSDFIQKNHGWFRNSASWLNNLVLTYLLNKPYDLYFSTFIIMNRDTLDEVIKYKGAFPYIQGLVLRSTNNYGQVLVEHKTRQEGQSNYTVRKLVNLWLNILINFSSKPLRLMTFFGAFTFMASSIALIALTVLGIGGWASFTCALFLLFSIQSIFLGIIGEYLGKLYMDHNGTPQYVLKSQR